MTLLSSIPVLNCHHIESTLDFYQRILQFVVMKRREANGQLDWTHLMNGSVTLMLQRTNNVNTAEPQQGSPQRAITLYYFSDDIKALHHFVKVNYTSVSELVETAYRTQEFTLRDPEGNVVIIGQSI